MKKIVINNRIIHEIKEYATIAFKNERDLSRFSSSELQVYLILQGLESVLSREKADIGYEFPVIWPEDSEAIDQTNREPDQN